MQWSDHFIDWRQSVSDFRDGWRPLLAYELLFKGLSFAFLAPLTAWILRALLRWSGNIAISNFDLIDFFLSPQGILLVALIGILGFVVVYAELGGLVLILHALRKKRKPRSLDTLLFLGARLRSLTTLGFIQFLILGGIAMIVLAITFLAKTIFLGGGDIYFYLQTKPPEYWIAISITGLAFIAGGIATVTLAIRWTFAVPLLLLEGKAPRESMSESEKLVRAIGVAPFLKGLASWAIISLLISSTVGVVLWILEKLLVFFTAGDVGWLIGSVALLQAIALSLGIIAGFMMTLAFSGLITRFVELALSDSHPPDAIIKGRPEVGKARRIRIRWWIGGIAGGMGLFSVGVAGSLINQLNFDSTVAVTAHRGSSLAAPENTRAAIVRAIEEGSDFVEIDVQETADGVVVLIHDTDLRRLAGAQRNIWEVPYPELREYDIGSWFSENFSGERIVTLAEAIELVRGRSGLNIELKFNGNDQRLEAAVEEIVRKAGFEEKSIVMSLDYNGIRKIAALNENLKTGLTLTAVLGDPIRFDVDFLAVNANAVTRDLVARAHQAGMEIHVWTVNDPAQMLTMLHLGVDNIITDSPGLLAELLDERTQLTNAEKTLLYLSDFLAGRL